MDLSNNVPPDDKASLLFISSDRVLLGRLDEEQVHLAKPKSWMSHVAKVIATACPAEFPSSELDLIFNAFAAKMSIRPEDIAAELKEKLSI